MSLTELSYYLRKLLPVGVLTLLMFFIFYYAIKIILIYGASNQPVVINYKTTFGKITAPVIPEASPSGQFSYSFDTIEGKPITATAAAKIFHFTKASTKFGYKEKTNLMAQAFGFDTTAVQPSQQDTNSVYTDDNQTLSVDITNFNFTYQYNLQKNPDAFTNPNIPSDNDIVNRAADFLKRIDRYPDDFARGKTKIIYYAYNPQTTEMNISDVLQQDTNMVEVDFYRPDITAAPSDLSTVSPLFYSSQNYVAMVFNDGHEKVVKAQVKYFDTDDQVGVYRLKTGDTAWQQLQSGQGFVVSSQPGVKNVSIKRMFLAYFDPDVYQDYMQPVYVFQGDNNFVGYVPAVDDNYVAKDDGTTQPSSP